MEEASYWKGALLLLVAWIVVTSGNLWNQSISNPDEPRYACAARSMIRGGDNNDKNTGNWTVPYFNGEQRLKKPPLFYWLMAGAGKGFEAAGLPLPPAFRLISVLAGGLALLALIAIGRLMYSQRVGMLAGGMFITCWYTHEMGRQLTVDMLLTAFLMVAWAGFLKAYDALCYDVKDKNRPPAWPGILLMYVAAGLAALTKGPFVVGMFFFVPAFAFMWMTKRLGFIPRFGLFWGIPLFLALSFFWLAIMPEKDAQWAMDLMMHQNVTRAIGRVDHKHPVPFAFYIADFPQRFIPWVILIPFAAWWSVIRIMKFNEGKDKVLLKNAEIDEKIEIIKERNRHLLPEQEPESLNRDSLRKFSVPVASEQAKFFLGALLVPFCILSCVISKRGLYLLPLYPLIALWLAWAWDNLFFPQSEDEEEDDFLEDEKPPEEDEDEDEDLRALVKKRRISKKRRKKVVKDPNIAIGYWWGVCLWIIMIAGALAAFVPYWPEIPKLAEANLPELIITGVIGVLLIVLAVMRKGAEKSGLVERHTFLLFAAVGLLLASVEYTVKAREERFADRASFYEQLKELAGDKKLVLMGYSSNEAVWYLDRQIDDVRRRDDDNPRLDLKKSFFDVDNALLLVRGKEWNDVKRPELKEHLILIKELKFKGETYYLAEKNPDNLPKDLSEKVFKRKYDDDL